MIISSIGDVFYSMLSEKPQNIDDIVKKMCGIFPEIPISVIRKDCIVFFRKLYAKGFAYCGEDRLLDNKRYFSYENVNPYEIGNYHAEMYQNVYEKTFGCHPRLTRVHIDISSRCNENCVHCYIPVNKKCSMMTADMFDKILAQCIDLKVLNITISGGEPMLNPNLKEFLLKCIDNNFSVNLLSNLTLLTDELLDIIDSNPLISVQTSLYAMNEVVHDTITNHKGSFRKTYSAIIKLHKRNIPLQINCPIMKQNLNYYKEVLDFAESKNIEVDADCSLYGCYDGSKRNLSCRLEYEEISEVIRNKFSSISKTESYIEQVQNRKTGENDAICPVCKNSLCISNNGNVYPCEGWQSLSLGNLEDNSLSYIWEDSPITNKLRNLIYKDFPKCNSCIDKKYCSVCLIMNVNEDIKGNYKNINSFQCKVAKIKRECIKAIMMTLEHKV